MIGILLSIYQPYQTNLSPFLNSTVNLVGTIENIEQLEHKRFKRRVTICIQQIKKDASQTWQPIKQKIQIYTCGFQHLQIQDKISIDTLTIKKIRSSDFGRYLLKEGIASTIFLPYPKYILLKRPKYSLKRYLFELRRRIFNQLKQKISPKTFSLVSSLFLGNKTIGKKQLEKTRQQFKAWGALHILARSGLHLVIFIMLWQFLLNFIPLPFTLKQIIILGLCCLYWLLSWPSVSFMRAFLTLFFYKLNIALKKQIHFLHILTLTCAVLLLYNPIQLFFLDFQLSFGLTFVLAWFNELSTYKFRTKN